MHFEFAFAFAFFSHREASSWLPLCYEYFDTGGRNVDFWGDVAIGKCLALFSIYAYRPSKRVVMKNYGGDTATKDVLRKKLRDRQCILSVHKLDENTIRDVHTFVTESRHAFPAHFCGQEKNGWTGEPVLRSCDLPLFDDAELRHHVADFCSARMFNKQPDNGVGAGNEPRTLYVS